MTIKKIKTDKLIAELKRRVSVEVAELKARTERTEGVLNLEKENLEYRLEEIEEHLDTLSDIQDQLEDMIA